MKTTSANVPYVGRRTRRSVFVPAYAKRKPGNVRWRTDARLQGRYGRAMSINGTERFKRVNDSLGHATGDKLLQEVAKRLTGAVRGSDTVSRYGGDEFVIVLSELGHRAHARVRAEKMRARLSAPNFIEQRQLHVKVSIGISIFPEDGQDAQTLIDCADFAMYRAKATRRPLQFFGPG